MVSKKATKEMSPERRERVRAAQRAYNARERDALKGFRTVHGHDAVKNQRAFRALLKEKGWAVGSHGRKRPPSPERQLREIKFSEEALDRHRSVSEYEAIYGGK
ncbi:MAG: hypothetical protein WB782_01640 [Thermoplasmata archaeon]